jgi:hypothetical protein
MQSCQVNGSAVKARAALHQCAVQRSAVGSRKAQLSWRLCRAARPAAVGAPIVEAPPEQGPASCRAVRPSAASAPVRRRAQEFSGLRRQGQESSTRRATTLALRHGPASTQRLHCLVLAPRAGIGRAAAHAGIGVGSIRRMQMPQALRSCNRRAVCEQNTVTANPSIERTSKRLRLFAAAHVER